MFGGNGLFSYMASSIKSPASPSTPIKDVAPVEVIKDRFYFASFGSKQALSTFMESLDPKTSVVFTIDRVLQYEPFCHDFGPLNIGKLYRFCQIVNAKLEDPEYSQCKIYVYSCNGSKKRSNLAYLVGAYQVLCLERTAEEACNVVCKDQPEYLPFRDASMGHCTYKLTVEHCIQAVQTGVRLGFIDWKNFDIDSYEHYERVENGDLTVIIPGKFVHFSGPTDAHKDSDGYPTLNPEHYVPIFKKFGVTDIVRLNQPLYDRNTFVNHGINHHDMYFVDGTTPSQALLDKFIRMCENAKGAIAVHCKAGLGRTGTVVGCYMMKHYKMTASEVIGWLRVCRPGSVLGPQQQYLEKMQPKMWAAGSAYVKPEPVLKVSPSKNDVVLKDSPFWLQPWSTSNVSSSATQEEEDEDGFMLMQVDDEDEFGMESAKGMDIDGSTNIGLDKVMSNRYSTGGVTLAEYDEVAEKSNLNSQGDILMRQKTEAQKHRFLM